MPQKTSVLIKCHYSLGDVVVLTGAIRELHEQYPNEFLTKLNTGIPEVWENNPYAARFLERPKVVVDCKDVEIDRTGSKGIHYLEAYLQLLDNRLGTKLKPSRLAGDIYLSDEEKRWYSEVYNFSGLDVPYWIVCSGGKFDIPIKWWSNDRYQHVIDHFRGRLQFVQIGTWGNEHPRLKGTIDLRGKTAIRDLIHLVYHSKGVLSGVTSLMHLAAAVPTTNGTPRPAVILGGAREPATWEAYPEHQFISTAKDLPCAHCWRCTVVPNRLQTPNDTAHCPHVRHMLPQCMDMISPFHVIEKIEKLLQKHKTSRMPPDAIAVAKEAVRKSEMESSFDEHNINPGNALQRAEEFIGRMPSYPKMRFAGRGVVICSGGVTHFTGAWVCINMLRRTGCKLPIEVWHLGRHEFDKKMEALLAPFDVVCFNARDVMNRYRFRNPLGWELKSYAVLHSRFSEVLLLDADNVPTGNPEELFDSRPYKETGVVFWPDYRSMGSKRAIWKLTGIKYRHEPEFETGQFIVNKARCWEPLQLAFWYNNHSEFFFKYIHGDKETFHLAWRKLGIAYSMIPYPIRPLLGTMCQHNFEGEVLFQHRNMKKWRFFGRNENVPGFVYEKECFKYIEKLKEVWDGRINGRREFSLRSGFKLRMGSCDADVFESVCAENEYRLPPELEQNDVVIDVGAHIGSFSAGCYYRGSRKIFAFEPHPENAELASENLAALEGIKFYSKAVLDRDCHVKMTDFPETFGGQNTGGGQITITENGGIDAIALDAILQEFQTVKILKLDCEGSEWAILAKSTELSRVENICGEYHTRSPKGADSSGQGRGWLRDFLSLRYPFVRTTKDRKNLLLGKFWASRDRSFFSLIKH
jgi:FkbM family methyltransferase